MPEIYVHFVVISLIMGGAGTTHIRPPLEGPAGFVYLGVVTSFLDFLAHEIEAQ